jgi:hypothetical protein
MAICSAGLVCGLGGCGQQTVRNCPIIGADPSSNVYKIDYELLIPADCPIPLASPGTEVKYAAARLTDLDGVDMQAARIDVTNSKGASVGSQVTPFVGVGTGVALAEVRAEYVAGTGTRSFSDYDMASFRAWHPGTGKTAKGQTRLTYQQTNLSTSVSGERVPLPNSSHTWNAPAAGGYPGYSYQWYQNDVPVGTGSSYTATTGSTDFNLRVEVTDQTWSTVAAVLAVNVGGVEAALAGPKLLNEGERGTWTASARGGTGTYTYSWYYDEQLVGSGTSYSRTPTAGTHEVRVQVRDGAGEQHGRSMYVTSKAATCPNFQRVC